MFIKFKEDSVLELLDFQYTFLDKTEIKEELINKSQRLHRNRMNIRREWHDYENSSFKRTLIIVNCFVKTLEIVEIARKSPIAAMSARFWHR